MSTKKERKARLESLKNSFNQYAITLKEQLAKAKILLEAQGQENGSDKLGQECQALQQQCNKFSKLVVGKNKRFTELEKQYRKLNAKSSNFFSKVVNWFREIFHKKTDAVKMKNIVDEMGTILKHIKSSQNMVKKSIRAVSGLADAKRINQAQLKQKPQINLEKIAKNLANAEGPEVVVQNEAVSPVVVEQPTPIAPPLDVQPISQSPAAPQPKPKVVKQPKPVGQKMQGGLQNAIKGFKKGGLKKTNPAAKVVQQQVQLKQEQQRKEQEAQKQAQLKQEQQRKKQEAQKQAQLKQEQQRKEQEAQKKAQLKQEQQRKEQEAQKKVQPVNVTPDAPPMTNPTKVQANPKPKVVKKPVVSSERGGLLSAIRAGRKLNKTPKKRPSVAQNSGLDGITARRDAIEGRDEKLTKEAVAIPEALKEECISQTSLKKLQEILAREEKSYDRIYESVYGEFEPNEDNLSSEERLEIKTAEKRVDFVEIKIAELQATLTKQAAPDKKVANDKVNNDAVSSNNDDLPPNLEDVLIPNTTPPPAPPLDLTQNVKDRNTAKKKTTSSSDERGDLLAAIRKGGPLKKVKVKKRITNQFSLRLGQDVKRRAEEAAKRQQNNNSTPDNDGWD